MEHTLAPSKFALDPGMLATQIYPLSTKAQSVAVGIAAEQPLYILHHDFAMRIAATLDQQAGDRLGKAEDLALFLVRHCGLNCLVAVNQGRPAAFSQDGVH